MRELKPNYKKSLNSKRTIAAPKSAGHLSTVPTHGKQEIDGVGNQRGFFKGAETRRCGGEEQKPTPAREKHPQLICQSHATSRAANIAPNNRFQV